jgi:DNA-binding transcriptional ArsR family regulator
VLRALPLTANLPKAADPDRPGQALDICSGFYNYPVLELIGYLMSPSDRRLDAVFTALADPTRRAILARLASGEASVNELAEPFDMSQPAVSKHLKVLERAGLISIGQEAQRRPRRLEGDAMLEAIEWLERYRAIWEQNYQRLDALLAELTPNGGARAPQTKPNRKSGKK